MQSFCRSHLLSLRPVSWGESSVLCRSAGLVSPSQNVQSFQKFSVKSDRNAASCYCDRSISEKRLARLLKARDRDLILPWSSSLRLNPLSTDRIILEKDYPSCHLNVVLFYFFFNAFKARISSFLCFPERAIRWVNERKSPASNVIFFFVLIFL